MEIETVLSLGFIQREGWGGTRANSKMLRKKLLHIFVLILDRISSSWKC
jgi:hypothetical protein